MAHVRRRSARLGLASFLALCLLAGVATAAVPDPPPQSRKERVEALWLDVGGGSGWIRTMPIYLDDEPASIHFGPAFCGRSHRLGEPTLRALQAALASGQPVRIDAEPRGTGEGARRCVTGVAFFAP